MSLSFDGGRPFPNDHYGQSRVTAQVVRRAIIERSERFSGDAIFVPPVHDLARRIGVTTTSVSTRSKGPKGFIATIEHATGLIAIQRVGGLVLYSDESVLEPLADHPPAEPVTLSPAEIELRKQQIAELARDLPTEITRQIGQQLVGA